MIEGRGNTGTEPSAPVLFGDQDRPPYIKGGGKPPVGREPVSILLVCETALLTRRSTETPSDEGSAVVIEGYDSNVKGVSRDGTREGKQDFLSR